MKKNNCSRMMLILMIACVTLSLLTFVIVCYDKFIKKEERLEPAILKPIDVSGNENKIYITRNGVKSLENVPSELVGKYVADNASGDYFIINANATLEMPHITGCSDCSEDAKTYYDNLSFELVYTPNSSVGEVTLIINNANEYVSSYKRIGKKVNGTYEFVLTENTPTSNANETKYIKR